MRYAQGGAWNGGRWGCAIRGMLGLGGASPAALPTSRRCPQIKRNNETERVALIRAYFPGFFFYSDDVCSLNNPALLPLLDTCDWTSELVGNKGCVSARWVGCGGRSALPVTLPCPAPPCVVPQFCLFTPSAPALMARWRCSSSSSCGS